MAYGKKSYGGTRKVPGGPLLKGGLPRTNAGGSQPVGGRTATIVKK